jgi:hypothetical protein
MNDAVNNWATTENPNGLLRAGTIIKIEGAPTKADNGTFELCSPMLPQGDGRACFLWRRMTKRGAVLTDGSARNIRGATSRAVAELMASGVLTVVSEPSEEKAVA